MRFLGYWGFTYGFESWYDSENILKQMFLKKNSNWNMMPNQEKSTKNFLNYDNYEIPGNTKPIFK